MAKRYEELTLADDFMFCKIMTANPDLCRKLAELIIGRKISRILTISKQLPVEITNDGRGVRFDVYMEDDSNTVYNIEMQTGKITELPYRTRYYQGMIDLDQLERGSKFKDLKLTYIIFICLDNLFPNMGLHKYCFRTACRELPELELGDRIYKIILSAKGTSDDVSDEVKAFLEYIAGRAPVSDFTRRLNMQIKKARAHIEWRKEYMTLLERDERMREEGREEGREEERANTAREAARAELAERENARLRAELEALRKMT